MDGNPTLDREIHRVVKRADVLVAMVKAACERAEILVESARETQQLIARRILSAERLPPRADAGTHQAAADKHRRSADNEPTAAATSRERATNDHQTLSA